MSPHGLRRRRSITFREVSLVSSTVNGARSIPKLRTSHSGSGSGAGQCWPYLCSWLWGARNPTGSSGAALSTMHWKLQGTQFSGGAIEVFAECGRSSIYKEKAASGGSGVSWGSDPPHGGAEFFQAGGWLGKGAGVRRCQPVHRSGLNAYRHPSPRGGVVVISTPEMCFLNRLCYQVNLVYSVRLDFKPQKLNRGSVPLKFM